MKQKTYRTAAGLAVIGALMHLWAAPDHLQEWWAYGLFFYGVALAQLGLAAALLRGAGRRLLLAGGGGSLALAALYVISRIVGLPIGPHAGLPEAPDIAGVAAAVSAALLPLALGRRSARLVGPLAMAAALCYGGGFWLHLLHASTHRTSDAQWLRDSSALLPLSVAAMLLATWLSGRLAAHDPGGRRLAPALGATLVSLAMALGGPLYAAAAGLGAAAADDPGLAFICSVAGLDASGGLSAPAVARDGMLLLLANLALATALAMAARIIGWAAARPGLASLPGRALRRYGVAGLALGTVILSPFGAFVSTSPTTAAPASCGASSYVRSYDVVAINVDIPYNRWGDIDFNGMMYALSGDAAAYKHWHLPLSADPANDPAGNRRLRPRPLVLRANAGECIKVNFSNQLNERQWGGDLVEPRAAMAILGLAYSAQSGGDARVGYNDDNSVGRGESITYYWQAPQAEGLYNFHDSAAPTGTEADGGSMAHGLFGALAVEPAGSIWLDPVSGRELYTQTGDLSGELYIDAIIQPPGQPAFRESVQLSQDEIPGIGFGFNYGAEPAHNREASRCPDCVGEETALSSWTYGDPALVKLASGLGPWLPAWQTASPQADQEDCGLGTPGFNSESCWTANVTHAYRWDRFKLRYALSMTYETHIFHLHANQWLAQPDDPSSTIIDSQTYGPGEAFTADLIGGAGSVPGTVGDSIFHCHLYPHFAEGFWALLRVHDTFEDGTQRTPDGIIVRTVRALPSGNLQGYSPPAPTPENPGFPRFIPGAYGWRAPQPPLGISEQNGQADDQGTLAREDLNPAVRMVAGQALDQGLLSADPASLSPAQLRLREQLLAEQRAMATISGGGSKPGAPFADPCPAGTREVTYNVSIIQLPIVYNEHGWFDSQARILVMDKDLDAVANGTYNPEPFFFRVNVGDCINFNLTNRLPNWFGNDAFVKLAQTNMMGAHIHLVKFDVLASDGSSNGWNYQQAAFTQAQTNFKNNILSGSAGCSADESAGACRLPLPASYDPTTRGLWPGQTIHARWFADVELRTVFTHDHHFAALDQNRGQFGALVVEPASFDVRHPVTGEYFQPINNPANGPVCGSACLGSAVGTRLDIIGPGSRDDFREFSLAFQDFVSLTRRGGNPANPSDTINPPAAPEAFPDEDPGTMAINYRNAPLRERVTRNGQWVDPAYIFSSTVWGDPWTPLLEAYAGDPVQFRLVQGSQEEQHVFTIHGMRWRHEPADPSSPMVNSVAIGVSEAFNLYVPQMNCGWDEDCRGDYLYSSAATDDIYNGMWGLMRVYGRNRNGLLPLPDTQPQDMTGNVNFRPTGSPPLPANKPGTPCEPGAPTRQFTVVAHDAAITYNEFGHHDPYGLIYSVVEPGETVELAVARGRANPQPMVLRANEGDCIEVTLHNQISQRWHAEHGQYGVRDGDPAMPTEPSSGTRAGVRVSLHPQLLLYDVRGSDGATVGYNRDQTVGPGQSITYRWFADAINPGELGAINLSDFGDVRGHRHHGLFAGMVIGPRGATYHNPQTGAAVQHGAFVDVRVPGQPDYRDFTLFYQDGLNLRDASGNYVPEPGALLPHAEGEPEEPGVGPLGEPADEDIGEKGFSYGNAPLAERLGRIAQLADDSSPLTGRELADLFSSYVHGDPATPIMRAYAGDPVRVRVLQGADRPRQHSFQIGGHGWLDDPYDPQARYIGVQGGISVARAVNIQLPAAGGPLEAPGDYRYGSVERNFILSRGLWGIFRVYPRPSSAPLFRPTALAPTDNPYLAGTSPLMPLEQVSLGATVFSDLNANGAWASGEQGLAGVTVGLYSTAGELLGTAETDGLGQVSFSAARGVYDLRVSAPSDWASTTPAALRLDARGENASVGGVFGMVQLGDAGLRLFHDRDGDGQPGPGEEPIVGWQVRLSQGGSSWTILSDAAGNVRFEGLRPGNYQLSVTQAAGWHALSTMPLTFSLAANDSLALSGPFALRAGMSVQVFNDANNNGRRDSGESYLSGWAVSATGGAAERPPTTAAGKTDPQGKVELDDPDATIAGLLPGDYAIGLNLPRDWSCASASLESTGPGGTSRAALSCADLRTTLMAQTTQVVTIGVRNPNHWVVAEPFYDANRNGVRESGEGKLVGWGVELLSDQGSLIATGITGRDGRASWYMTSPGNYASASYQVRVTPPAGAALPWGPTTAGGETVALSVVAGERGVAASPFVQLSTVNVVLFHDHDQSGTWDDHEDPLANRNIVLYNSRGSILATGFTDANGRAAFRISAGVTYQVEAILPAAWTRTMPLDSRARPVARLKFTAPQNNGSYEVTFGQYNTNDTTPPPAPTFSADAGSYTAAVTLGLSSEQRVRYYYTLDGSTPSPANGHPLLEPTLTLAARGPVTLKAVAVDSKGNVSPVSSASYTIGYPDGAAPARARFVAGAAGWTVTRGGIYSGYISDSYFDDNRMFDLRSVRISGTDSIDGYATFRLPEGQRNLTQLRIFTDDRTTRAGTAVIVSAYDVQRGEWAVVQGPGTASTTLSGWEFGVPNPGRFVSPSGEVRLRFELWTRSGSFRFGLDELRLITTYQP